MESLWASLVCISQKLQQLWNRNHLKSKASVTSVRLWVPEPLESLVCPCTRLAPDKVKWNSQAEYVASTAVLKCRSELILRSQLVHRQCCLCTSLCWSVDLGKAPEHTQGQQPSHAQFPRRMKLHGSVRMGWIQRRQRVLPTACPATLPILLSVSWRTGKVGHSWAVSWTMCTAPSHHARL